MLDTIMNLLGQTRTLLGTVRDLLDPDQRLLSLVRYYINQSWDCSSRPGTIELGYRSPVHGRAGPCEANSRQNQKLAGPDHKLLDQAKDLLD